MSELLDIEMKKFLEKVDNQDIKEILSYYYDLGGKRMRPILFYTISKAFNSQERLSPFLLVLELIHTMSLYHDDVIDNAEERRGAPTIHKKWDMPTAIVGGDIFHGLIHNHILNAIKEKEVNDTQRAMIFLSDLISKVELKIGTGVIQEMQMAMDKDIPTLNAAMDVTMSKTAPLFAFSASAAAYLAKMDDEICEKMYEMGMKLGFAFQLLDDISDYFPSNKGMGNDLREDRKTPILILCDEADHEKVVSYRLIGRNLTNEQIVQFMIDFKEQFNQLIEWVDDTLNKTLKLIEIIPNNEFRDYVKVIIELLVLQNEALKFKLL